MKAAIFDFVFEKGTDWVFNIGYNSGSAACYVPVDITGYSAEFKVYENRHPQSAPLLTLTTSSGITINASQGRFAFVLNKNVNNALTAQEYFYTFDITGTTGITERILKGSINIEP